MYDDNGYKIVINTTKEMQGNIYKYKVSKIQLEIGKQKYCYFFSLVLKLL